MTEIEWLRCTYPMQMLEFVRGKVSDRKLRLFACARCRQLWQAITDPRSRLAVEIGERFADQRASAADLDEARRAAQEVDDLLTQALADVVGATVVVRPVLEEDPVESMRWEAYWALALSDSATGRGLMVAARLDAPLLRDILGDPYWPFSLPPAWLTPVVVELGRAAYEERSLPSGSLDPIRLAVLADALEEAGCDNAYLLKHLRSPGSHVRGCFAVDGLLAKE